MDITKETLDPLFDKAVDYVIANKSISANDLMQFFNIDYNRAVILLEQMEEAGIVTWKEWDGNNKSNQYLVATKEIIKSKVQPQQKPYEYAGKNTSKKGNSKVLGYDGLEWFMALVSFTVILVIFISCSGKPSHYRGNYCSDDEGAYNHAKSFILSNLKFPSTAKFVSFSDVESSVLRGCGFKFIGYVDSQNSFGAMIRTKFNVTVSYEPNKDKYYLEHLDM
ncbi:cell division protein FtsK [Xenorhabdus mauleonii]|uniref:Cell division protein FtsK n=1 Tax=Xenorhabdus mauleonii TaxID=351675 RepID=A0A1I3WSQ5_9GAMM|nr:DNA translocase FtsK [Xenorhabdus mauleonii]PHM38134.1 cell division protein FtsK [Xenorhabdus mauleonii]SFK10223.1 Ftsk gamma domain-containing protein [Xenorhabdus mauleonii]